MWGIDIPFSSLVVDLLMPPTSLPWLALLAVLLPRRVRRVSARVAAAVFLVPLVLLSTPVVGQALIHSLQAGALDAKDEKQGRPVGAIVILSAEAIRGLGPKVLEVGPLTLERERAGAALQRETGLPVLVTGGLVNGPPPVGQLMAASMAEDFGVPVRWVEDRSATTWENARFSAPLLKASGVDRVYLVTHAWHMRRAVLAFERAGIEVVPAPLRLDPGPDYDLGALLPRMSGWSRSYYGIHEWIGLLFYRWRS